MIYTFREKSWSDSILLSIFPQKCFIYLIGGDIFIHAKCNNYGKLFELTQAIMNNLPPRSVDRFEDIYGWVYRNGRDLSGFIDGKLFLR